MFVSNVIKTKRAKKRLSKAKGRKVRAVRPI